MPATLLDVHDALKNAPRSLSACSQSNMVEIHERLRTLKDYLHPAEADHRQAELIAIYVAEALGVVLESVSKSKKRGT